jgi:hypothetical protein
MFACAWVREGDVPCWRQVCPKYTYHCTQYNISCFRSLCPYAFTMCVVPIPPAYPECAEGAVKLNSGLARPLYLLFQYLEAGCCGQTGYLPGMMYPNIKFFGTMSLAYITFGLFWALLYAQHWREVFMLQHFITAVIALGMMEMSTWCAFCWPLWRPGVWLGCAHWKQHGECFLANSWWLEVRIGWDS